MGNRISYSYGQELGPYHMKYIRETEPDIRTYNPNAHVRKAEFECGFCGKHFVARIGNIKNGHTKSCGCQALIASTKVIQQWNSTNPTPWNKVEYKSGQTIGDSGVIFVQDEPNRRHGRKNLRYAKFQCPICREYFVSLLENVALNKVKSCGNHISLGEEKIAKILSDMDVLFIRQKTFSNLYSQGACRKYPLRFDFFLPKYNCCLEYDGIQHFSYRPKNSSTWNTKENYQDTKKRNNIKNKYCQENHIFLVRIPYTEKEKLNIEYFQNILSNLSGHDYNHLKGNNNENSAN